MDLSLTRSERETLKALYRLTKSVEGAHTGTLAESLGVSPGTATATVKRLADRGLVDHRPYKGVELTVQGRRGAVAAIRRHRIVERFLSDMLGYPWNEADRFAASFEHELPQEVEDRLFVALHRPDTCPHGFPIPEPEVADIPQMPPLYALEPGDRATVAVPGSTDPDVVAFLDTLGLRPAVRVEVVEKHPFGGPIVVSVDGENRTVGEKLAQQIYVKQDDVPGPDVTGPDVTGPDVTGPDVTGPADVGCAGAGPSDSGQDDPARAGTPLDQQVERKEQSA